MKKQQPHDVLKKYVKSEDNFACLLGSVNTHCELISRGVRDAAEVLFKVTDKKAKVVKELAAAWGVGVRPVVMLNGAVVGYYLYSPKGGQGKVEEINKLHNEIAELRKRGKKSELAALHKRIGALFGYSKEIIEDAYK